VLLVAVLAIGGGLGLSFLEYTKPLKAFSREAQRFAKGEVDQMQPSRFRSLLRQVASDLNDGVERAVARGGGSSRAADLQQVMGDLPDQPQMSAFSLPVSGVSDSPPSDVSSSSPTPPPSQRRAPPPPRHRDGTEPTLQAAQAPDADEEPDWQHVFSEFVRTKQSCGESTDGVTFEKFKQTLRKNRDALAQRHGVAKVKFSVYVKDGRAALKANPIRES
jgi:hypothetical protein